MQCGLPVMRGMVPADVAIWRVHFTRAAVPSWSRRASRELDPSESTGAPVDDNVGERMSYRELAEALAGDEPYFGPAMRALQGPPERHGYYLPAVKAAAAGRTSDFRILEIGSWAGASTVSWASALRALGVEGQITCVDPWLPRSEDHTSEL